MMPGPFAVVDLASLEWFVDKLACIQEKQDRIQAQAKAMISDLERDAESLRYQFQAQAEAVARAELTNKRGKTKHIKFLSGTIQFRTVPAKLRVTSSSKAFAWASQNAPDALQTTLDIKRLCTLLAVSDDALTNLETGEVIGVPDGFEVDPASERVSITTQKDGAS